MGKDVIKMSKGAGEVGLVEVIQLSMGVRTRAKTQTLQGLLHQNSTAPAGEGSYLQLRNRRLQKPPNFSCQTERKPSSRIANTSKPTRTTVSRKRTASKSKVIGSPNSRSNTGSTHSFNRLGIQPQSKVERVRKAEAAEERNINLHVGAPPLPVDASSSSLGEKALEFEACTARLRGTMERTASSSTRRRSRFIPTSNEMDRFFLGPEQQQQIQFIEKYNFDPVNDKPLQGRFEWKKLHPK